jgi:hypothetical protein
MPSFLRPPAKPTEKSASGPWLLRGASARVEQIPILRYTVVRAGLASEGGAGVVAACAKNRQTNPITWSVLNDLAFLWGAAPRVSRWFSRRPGEASLMAHERRMTAQKCVGASQQGAGRARSPRAGGNGVYRKRSCDHPPERQPSEVGRNAGRTRAPRESWRWPDQPATSARLGAARRRRCGPSSDEAIDQILEIFLAAGDGLRLKAKAKRKKRPFQTCTTS